KYRLVYGENLFHQGHKQHLALRGEDGIVLVDLIPESLQWLLCRRKGHSVSQSIHCPHVLQPVVGVNLVIEDAKVIFHAAALEDQQFFPCITSAIQSLVESYGLR